MVAENADNKYHKVAEKKPNKMGFYDLLGNVSEWTMDEYESNYYERIAPGIKDPVSHKTKEYPVTVRGGNYKSLLSELRLTNRIKSESIGTGVIRRSLNPSGGMLTHHFIGLRVVRPRVTKTQEEVESFFESVLKNKRS